MVSTRGKRVKYNKDVSSSGSEDAESKTEKQPPAKRRKNDGEQSYSSSKSKGKAKATGTEASTSTTTRPIGKPKRRLQGRLADLMNMPIDVFTDICSHLHPLDLLHLAWASKALRGILMSRSSRAIWKTARENQVPDLPACPDQLTEPQYTALVFTTVCQACGSLRALRRYYELYSRYCANCADDHVIRIGSYNSSGSELGFLVGMDRMITIIPNVFAAEIGGSKRHRYRWASKDTMDLVKEEWETLQTPSEKDDFIASRQAIVRSIHEHTSALVKWQAQQDQKKNLKATNIRETRLQGIKDRLLTMGWDAGDFPRYQYTPEERAWGKLAEKNQPLTDKVWDNLYPKLKPLLQVFQDLRLKKERADRTRNRTQQLVKHYNDLRQEHSKEMTDTLFPGGSWSLEERISNMTPLKKLIDDDDHGPITTKRWEEKVPDLIEFLKTRTAEVEQVVATWYSSFLKLSGGGQGTSSLALPAKSDENDCETKIDLRRPTVVFRCIDCYEPLWYPACFQHRHVFESPTWSDISTWRASVFGHGYGPLRLSFDSTLNSIISCLLVHVGVNPDSVLSADLPPPLPNPLSPDYNPDTKYMCLLCDEMARQPVTMVKLIDHLRKESDEFQIRQEAITTRSRFDFPNLEEAQEIPLMRNDHDLSVRHTPATLWKQVSEDDILLNKKRKEEYFERIAKYRSEEYRSVTGRFWTESYYRYCILCPTTSRYGSSTFGEMLIHIKSKHGVDVESELEVRLVELEQAREDAIAAAEADSTAPKNQETVPNVAASESV